jgi:hypothetical protein
VTAQKKVSPVSLFRKNIEAKRSTMLKENYNKLLMIGSADAKFVSDTFVALDALHKEMFDTMGAKFTPSKERETEADETTEIVAGEDEENIFRNK